MARSIVAMITLALSACTTYAERLDQRPVEHRRGDDEAPPAPARADLPPPAEAPAPVAVEDHAPPSACRALAFIESDTPTMGKEPYERAAEALRREARKRGGNYVHMQWMGQLSIYKVVVRGRLYDCPAEALAQAPPAASSSPAAQSSAACEPDCSPGFVCLRGRCVSACNPPCGDTERCGADRICHRDQANR
jgi:hypothetical protein